MSNSFIQRFKRTFAAVGVLGSASLLVAFVAESSAASAQPNLSYNHQAFNPASYSVSYSASQGANQRHTLLSQRLDPPGDPEQVPTARYARGEAVDLSLIVEEWRGRYPATPVFACTCRAETCGDDSIWPFRTFTLYQPFLALGRFNAANNEEFGFNCFDMETGDRP